MALSWMLAKDTSSFSHTTTLNSMPKQYVLRSGKNIERRNRTIEIKIKERLNKLDSLDYDNIECWQIVEAFNKSQLMWCRRQLHGGNIYKEGDEMSKRRVDDLQILLKELTLLGSVTTDYFESNLLPGSLE